MALAVLINDAMRGGLEALTRAGNTAQKLAQRARIVLLASQGHSDSEISRKLDIDRKTAALWRRRVAEPEARDQAAEPTAERDAAPGTQARVAQPGTTEKPVSERAAERLFKFSKDKHFVEKLTDVVGIYKDPPPNSVVYCVDEKSGIQALDRTQPGLPWKKGKCGTRTHDYKRHGTTTLFAAYNVGTGQVIGECHPRHSNQEFLCLLRRLDRETAPGLEIHILLDNASYHNHDNVKKWLGKHRRFQFHFIPTSSSWTNLVERWFGLLTQQCIRRGVFHSVEELKLTIYRYMETHNIAPKPFRWRASVQKILEKIQRAAWVAGITLPWSLPPPVAP